MDQDELISQNRIAWETDSYQAWVNHYGPPVAASAVVVSNPSHVLRRVLDQIGDIARLKIANPLGSLGRVAVAMALLGAEVTVFDLSESNARYARELAENAGVKLEYIVGDFQD